MRIAILTAGGAGMFCGSCMHDNTLARALIAAGHECVLVPCYTPIRVDEENQSGDRVFFGGLNLYLDHKVAWWSRIPVSVRRLLDRPSVLRMLSRFESRSNAAELGELTLAMLRGEDGPLKIEIAPLVEYLTEELKPDVIIFSNALMAGPLKSLQERFDGPVLCMMQGDDIFLDGLVPAYKAKAIEQTARLAQQFDGLLSHTDFYAEYMSQYLGVDRDHFRKVPLGIDTTEYDSVAETVDRDEVTIGFFARLAPEKGLHYLTDAFLKLHEDLPIRLRVGGFAHQKDRAYQQVLTGKLVGTRTDEPVHPETLEEKIAFLESLDILSVPTEFLEPKGLPVLEAMASGRPVVQPAHGAFPEMLNATGGGLLVKPRDADALAGGLRTLIEDRDQRLALTAAGRQGVRDHFSMDAMVRGTIDVLSEFVTPKQSGSSRDSGAS